MTKRLFLLFLGVALSALALVGLGTRAFGVPPLGPLLDPRDGLYRTARLAEHPSAAERVLAALDAPVTVLRDVRGVPHIFAESDRDALMAFGYAVAQDRLFQLDFIPRVVQGRLAEVFGPASLEADRFLRSTGMAWAARRHRDALLAEGSVERDIVTWFGEGVNAYIDGLEERDLPFEFRLLGYRPARYEPLHALLLLQYMTYDLTYRTDDADYAVLRERLGEADYRKLYPPYSSLYVPIIPEPGSGARGEGQVVAPLEGEGATSALMQERAVLQAVLRGTPAEGFLLGKGSNNWAVSGSRSATGAPILAGDMHLSLTLPAIWYEVHLATPSMNTYGVTVPGAPLPVEAFNEHLAWAFTNTGSDQIDHLALDLDETGTRYRFEGGYRDLDIVLDTIFVQGEAPVLDTLVYSHWGPVIRRDGEAVALRWVAHERSSTLRALWGMNHAENLDAFEAALRFWDTPMQNILYADVDGNIAIRSTGLLPVRKSIDGAGLRDGSTDGGAWVGRVPFEALPYALNPAQGYLSSTNQQPADSTYPYYLGHDWRDAYRSLRIDSLLRSQPRHSVEDLKRYQADVHAVQHDLFTPLLDTLTGFSARADTLRQMLAAWDGATTVDRPAPLVFDEFLQILRELAWDERVFVEARRPAETQLFLLLRDEPRSKWLDVQATDEREDAATLLRHALDATADTLAARYGWGEENWRWGDHHKLVVRHLTQSEALRPLWRGPYEFSGFHATLSPAGRRRTTHTASWRVVVDFSQSPPQGYGIYPGGQSGNPFSPLYDLHLPDFLAFRHYELLKPVTASAMDEAAVSSRLVLRPGE